jgi:hypothetical protein
MGAGPEQHKIFPPNQQECMLPAYYKQLSIMDEKSFMMMPPVTKNIVYGIDTSILRE